MNTWNALPVSYKQRVYKNTLATVKRQSQQADSPTPGKVIGTEAAYVANSILLDYFSCKVVHKEPEIGSTYHNIPKDNYCIDDKLDFGMPGS
jgi:hypothetical protein